MEKRLIDGVVNLTTRKVAADRKVWKETVTYEPHGNSGEDMNVHALVYELLIIAAYDQLQVGKTIYGGDYTAAEMAGTICGMRQFMDNCNPEWEDYKDIRIKTKTFDCSFDARLVFEQMAEWEGVAGITSAKAYRFHCEGKEMPKGTVLKPYKRCHGYRPTHVSYADTDRRLAGKFEVLGRLYEALSVEGIKKAMSVIAAARLFENKSYEVQAMVKKAMRYKLWKDYGNCERLHQREDWLKGEMQRTKDSKRYQEMKKELDEIRNKYVSLSLPIPFSASDFNGGPECYKQVDSKYVQVLVDHWNKMVADSPMPEWPKQGDVVQLKNRDRMQKKYQGKFLCEGMTASLSTYGDRIEWRASVRVKKFDNEYFLPGLLEPWVDQKKAASKRGKNGAGSNSSEREQARPKVKAKAKTKAKKSKPETTTASTMDLAEQLRQALLARLAA